LLLRDEFDQQDFTGNAIQDNIQEDLIAIIKELLGLKCCKDGLSQHKHNEQDRKYMKKYTTVKAQD